MVTQWSAKLIWLPTFRLSHTFVPFLSFRRFLALPLRNMFYHGLYLIVCSILLGWYLFKGRAIIWNDTKWNKFINVWSCVFARGRLSESFFVLLPLLPFGGAPCAATGCTGWWGKGSWTPAGTGIPPIPPIAWKNAAKFAKFGSVTPGGRGASFCPRPTPRPFPKLYAGIQGNWLKKIGYIVLSHWFLFPAQIIDNFADLSLFF